MNVKYLETILEKINLREFIIFVLFALFAFGFAIFCIVDYKTTYRTIYNERVDKIKYIDDLVIDILEYQNSLAVKNNIPITKVQHDAIEIIKSIQFKDEYIWIDLYKGGSVYHPIPQYSTDINVDSKIRKIVDEYNEGYLEYKWKKINANQSEFFDKISYVKLYKNWGWIVGNGVYINDINHKVLKSMLKSFLPVILFFILANGILRFILLNAIVKPIDKLAYISQKLAEGNLDVALPTAKSDTEFGKLYKIFNKFIEVLSKEKKAVQNEVILRNILTKIKVSLDIDEILFFVCSELAVLFDVQRVSIPVFLEKNDYKQFLIKNEYVTSPDIKTYSDAEDALETGNYWGMILAESSEAVAFDNIEESDVPDYFKNNYRDLNTLAIMGIAIKKAKNIWGCIILSDIVGSRHWTDEEKTLLKTVSDQVYLAINQAELYQKEKQTAQREKLLKTITEKIRSSLDIEETLSFICEETTKTFNVQRSAIAMYPEYKDYDNFSLMKDYTISPDLKSFKEIKDSAKILHFWEDALIDKNQIVAINNINEAEVSDYFKKSYQSIGVKSLLGISIKKYDRVWGTLVLSDYQEYRKWSEEDKELLSDIANQIYIALYQAELYEKEKTNSKREIILREIINKIRSSINLQDIKREIVNQVAMFLNADNVFFSDYNEETGNYIVTKESEYRSSEKLKSRVDFDFSEVPDFLEYVKYIHFKGNDIIFDNIDRYLDDNNLRGTGVETFYKLYDVVSNASINVSHGNLFLGNLVITFNKIRHISNDEMSFIRILADQAGIAIYQARLYEKEKLSAERERINRSIIEILRSSIDKTIIKKLFVKNIGKFFEADRVLLSEYDPVEKIYLPADKNSEYLSTPQEQSFVGYDWSKPVINELIQPLLEKREFNIYDWDEYIKYNQKSRDFMDFFENYNIKSSYNFPIIYQQNIMGFFCIDFTNNPRKLSDEDIRRIRNMCSQAGIALYHATLYQKAQECFLSKKSFVSKFSDKIKCSVNKILDKSILLSQNEFERILQIDYLNVIIDSCHKLLELTSEITEN